MAFTNFRVEEDLLIVGFHGSHREKLSTKEVDILQDAPGIKKIRIIGLNQELFDYFINNYAQNYESIFLHQCPRIHDWSAFESLPEIKSIRIYWNQKATSFWNFSKNPQLTRFQFEDVLKISKLDELAEAKSLIELDFGNAIHSKFILKSLRPIKNLVNLKVLSFNFKKIEDDSFLILAEMPNLEKINFPIGKFTTEEVAWLKARLKGKAKEEMYDATIQTKPIESGTKNKTLDTFIVGKGKPWLSSQDDAQRIQKYVDNYKKMVQWFEENPNMRPQDFGMTKQKNII